jgi:hypothetical protein
MRCNPFKIAAIILVVFLASIVLAQSQSRPQTQTQSAAPPPSTDIYVVDLNLADRKLSAGTPVNITNRKGYDNQPFFMPDGNQILFTSIRGDQSDIYRYNLNTKKEEQVTDTPESEYSPTLMPDLANISVVRVEPGPIQRLWRFPLNGGKPALILADVQPVGYHAWVDDITLALFVLGNPVTLQIADLRTGYSGVANANIGRSIHKIPGVRKVSFVQKDGEQWMIKELEVVSGKFVPIAKALASEDHDYAWMPDRTLLMALDSKLYKLKPGVDEDWVEVADFSQYGLKSITRIGVSPDGKRIAIVALE